MTITYGTPNTATSPVSSITVTLASTTVGDLNMVGVSVHSTPGHTGVQPVVATPDGWTLIGDSWKSGTPSHEVAAFWRIYQTGDPSTVTVECGTGTNQPGGWAAVPVAMSAGDFDPDTPIASGEASFTQSAGPTTNVTDSLSLGGDRTVFSLFGQRSGATWSAASDGNVHDSIGAQTHISGSASIAVCDSGGTTSSGAARSLLASASTSINNLGIWAVQPASTPSEPNHGSFAGAVSATGAFAGHAVRGVDAWIADRPMFVAHRGGSADWPEMTMYAYAQATAWHPGVGLNMDVVRSSDGVWVGSHDLTTGRVFGDNYTITSTAWSTLSTLRTTVGSQPMARLNDFLDTYGGDSTQPVWLDNKQGDVVQDDLLDWLDSNYAGWPEWLIFKGYYTAAASLQAAKDRGGRTWMYLYATDLGSHPTGTELAAADMLGMEYSANSTAWDTILSYDRPVLAHIVDTAAHKADADTNSGGDLAGYMVSGVEEVIPQTGDASGSFAGTVTHVGDFSGHTARAGAFAGTVTHTATVSGHTDRAGGFTGTVSHVGAVSGHTTRAGSFTGTVTHTASVSGHTDRSGSFTGTVTSAGSFSGRAPTMGEKHGRFTGTVTATGVFSGRSPAVGVRHGSFTGAVTVAGSFAGQTARSGSFAGSVTGTGTFSGHNGTVITRDITAVFTVRADHRTFAVRPDRRTLTVRSEP